MTFTKEQLIEDLKASTQNASGMFEIGEETICELVALLTAQPAPVSVPAAMEMDDDFDSAFEHGKAVGWNAYRAAMLQAGNHAKQHLDMVNSPVIPDGWVACSERMPDVSDVVLTAKDGVVNVGEMERSGANYRYFTSIASGRELPATHWQPLPAAPQQEDL